MKWRMGIFCLIFFMNISSLRVEGSPGSLNSLLRSFGSGANKNNKNSSEFKLVKDNKKSDNDFFYSNGSNSAKVDRDFCKGIKSVRNATQSGIFDIQNKSPEVIDDKDLMFAFEVLSNSKLKLIKSNSNIIDNTTMEAIRNITQILPPVLAKHVGQIDVYKGANKSSLINRAQFAVGVSKLHKDKLRLSINMYALKESEGWYPKTIVAALVHELGHVLANNDSQLTTTETNFKDDYVYSKTGKSHKVDSYLGRFLFAFYDSDNMGVSKNDDFVSHYASTDPSEDLADSFLVYVLNGERFYKNVKGKAYAKIKFFEFFPEAVELKKEINGRIPNSPWCKVK